MKERTDKLDAASIVSYACFYREEFELSTVKSMSHLEFGRLLDLRDQIVSNDTGLKGTLEEMKILLSIKPLILLASA